ncbi:MAG: acetylxylan esterase [Pirellulales bacterium]|nr:acetylxylan esterase [Pirellulales bacterium]
MSVRLPQRLRRFVRALLAFSIACSAAFAVAEDTRVLPPGKLPQDKRLGPLKTLNDDFPFAPPSTPEAWATRAQRVRRQVLVSNGLWPMPTKTPANAVVHGKIDRGEYTVEKVYLESFPGHFVTGNLYRPKGREGKLPGVLCPHGHWPNGRFYDAGHDKLQLELIQGAERFDPAGRYPLQARCVQLARMGCVVFHYDMIGYADSVQLEHRAGLREPMNTAENWGYFSPQAELRLQNIMGLQTYNSTRALDWFGSLPEVDPKRIAVTGASGGGTQTFILSAVDSRPAVAFPAVMVSTAMQGGCTCENACYLRVDSGNIEIAGLIAPRPLGMTAADDWTKQIETKGLPELKKLYKILGAENLVMAKPLLHFPHNYNYVSRAVMYQWLNQHLKLGLKDPIVEQDFQPLSIAEMSVWDDSHPKPPSGNEYERSLLKWITEDSRKQMEALVPSDAASLAKYREVVGPAVDVMIGRALPQAGAVQAAERKEEDQGDYVLVKQLIRDAAGQEEVPGLMLRPKPWNQRAVVWVDPQGKQGLFSSDGRPKAAVKRILEASVAVVGLDLFGQGEFTADGKPIAKTRINDSGRGSWAEYAGYTFGYNHPVFSCRVHDILSAVALLKSEGTKTVDLVGLAGAGRWVAAAKAQAGDAIDRAVIGADGFRFSRLTAFDDPDFLPGGAKYLDLPGIVALGAPGRVWLSDGTAAAPAIVTAAWRAAGKPENLTVFSGPVAEEEDAAVKWLLEK